jgi:hypothetical protein
VAQPIAGRHSAWRPPTAGQVPTTSHHITPEHAQSNELTQRDLTILPHFIYCFGKNQMYHKERNKQTKQQEQ